MGINEQFLVLEFSQFLVLEFYFHRQKFFSKVIPMCYVNLIIQTFTECHFEESNIFFFYKFTMKCNIK